MGAHLSDDASSISESGDGERETRPTNPPFLPDPVSTFSSTEAAVLAQCSPSTARPFLSSHGVVDTFLTIHR